MGKLILRGALVLSLMTAVAKSQHTVKVGLGNFESESALTSFNVVLNSTSAFSFVNAAYVLTHAPIITGTRCDGKPIGKVHGIIETSAVLNASGLYTMNCTVVPSLSGGEMNIFLAFKEDTTLIVSGTAAVGSDGLAFPPEAPHAVAFATLPQIAGFTFSSRIPASGFFRGIFELVNDDLQFVSIAPSPI